MKRQRRTTAGEDRISQLPDPILHHILSLLPTKLSASTTILSKRWKDLWTSLPVLDFRSVAHQDARFMDFMDRILCLHDSPIEKFYLVCNAYVIEESRVREWIATVTRRKVEVLYLFMHSRFTHPPLPPCFFTCESLSELNLDMGLHLKLPESVSFPRLKILRLFYVKFVDENLTQQLFSNCPVLEELVLGDCVWKDMDVISISSPTLKLLDIGDNRGLHNCIMKIYAPSLLSFTHNSHLADDYELSGFSSLVYAFVHFMLQRDQEGFGANNLLRGLSNVKRLAMSGESFETLSDFSDADVRLSNSLTFYNLIRLEVICFPCLADRTLFDFLQMSPNLESLVFKEGFCHEEPEEEQPNCNWTIDLLPQCFSLHLKSVEFQGYDGSQCTLNVIKLFLKNAIVLQKMIIGGSSLHLLRDAKKRVLMFPKGSTDFVIKFRRVHQSGATTDCVIKFRRVHQSGATT